MYVLFKYPVGVVVEGVVLANGKNRMRIVAPGFPDVIELRRTGPNWITDDSQCVDLEFIMPRSNDTPITAVKTSRQQVRAIGFTGSN